MIGKFRSILVASIFVLFLGFIGIIPSEGKEPDLAAKPNWFSWQIGDSIPLVVAITIDDTLIDTRQTLNGRFLLVNFFATWCKPCKEELPHLIQFAHEHEDSLQVVMIGLSGKEIDDFFKFRISHGVNFPIVWDRYGTLTEHLGIKYGPGLPIPITLLTDPDGHLQWFKVGKVKDFELEVGTVMRQ